MGQSTKMNTWYTTHLSEKVVVVVVVLVVIKGETESTIVAAQDQAISTNYFKNKI